MGSPYNEALYGRIKKIIVFLSESYKQKPVTFVTYYNQHIIWWLGNIILGCYGK